MHDEFALVTDKLRLTFGTNMPVLYIKILEQKLATHKYFTWCLIPTLCLKALPWGNLEHPPNDNLQQETSHKKY